MRHIPYVALSLMCMAGSCVPIPSSDPKENIITLRNLRARLDPNWIIMTHVPNGDYSRLVSAILADEQGKPRPDKSMILFGEWDVSGHDGLTMFQLLVSKHEKKNERKSEGWVINYAVEPKEEGYALMVDGFKYLEDRKCYLWVRRSRRIETPTYNLQEEDLKDILALAERTVLITPDKHTAPGIPGATRPATLPSP